MTTIGFGSWHVCYAVDGGCVRDAILIYSYRVCSKLRDAVWFEFSSMRFVECMARQGVCG